MSYSVWVRNDCVSLIDQAEKELAKSEGDGGLYWRGIKVAALVILKKHAWHVCSPAEKRRFDPEREKKERDGRNASAKARRAVKMSKLAHLHNYHTHTGRNVTDPNDWLRYGEEPECDSRRGLSHDEREEWTESNRLVMDPSEATCRECLDAAIEKKIPGAAEQLRKLWRKDEAEAMRER